MTKKRKNQLNAGLIVVSLGALAVDKLVLSDAPDAGLQTAGASPVLRSIDPTGVRAAPPETGGHAVNWSQILDRKLEDYAAVEPERDPFSLSSAMTERLERAAKKVDEAEPAVPEPDQAAEAAESFQSNHKLNGVMQAGQKSVAIVDGISVGLGQSLEGFLLVEVGTRSATFEYQDQRITLEVPLQ